VLFAAAPEIAIPLALISAGTEESVVDQASGGFGHGVLFAAEAAEHAGEEVRFIPGLRSVIIGKDLFVLFFKDAERFPFTSDEELDAVSKVREFFANYKSGPLQKLFGARSQLDDKLDQLETSLKNKKKLEQKYHEAIEAELSDAGYGPAL